MPHAVARDRERFAMRLDTVGGERFLKMSGALAKFVDTFRKLEIHLAYPIDGVRHER